MGPNPLFGGVITKFYIQRSGVCISWAMHRPHHCLPNTMHSYKHQGLIYPRRTGSRNILAYSCRSGPLNWELVLTYRESKKWCCLTLIITLGENTYSLFAFGALKKKTTTKGQISNLKMKLEWRRGKEWCNHLRPCWQEADQVIQAPGREMLAPPCYTLGKKPTVCRVLRQESLISSDWSGPSPCPQKVHCLEEKKNKKPHTRPTIAHFAVEP